MAFLDSAWYDVAKVTYSSSTGMPASVYIVAPLVKDKNGDWIVVYNAGTNAVHVHDITTNTNISTITATNTIEYVWIRGGGCDGSKLYFPAISGTDVKIYEMNLSTLAVTALETVVSNFDEGDYSYIDMTFDYDDSLYILTFEASFANKTAYLKKYVISTDTLSDLGSLTDFEASRGIGVDPTLSRVYVLYRDDGADYRMKYIPTSGGSWTEVNTWTISGHIPYLGYKGYHYVSDGNIYYADCTIYNADESKSWTISTAYTGFSYYMYEGESYPLKIFSFNGLTSKAYAIELAEDTTVTVKASWDLSGSGYVQGYVRPFVYPAGSTTFSITEDKSKRLGFWIPVNPEDSHRGISISFQSGAEVI